MKTLKTAAACLVAMTLAILSGCATTSQSARNVEQFDPVPPMAAGAQTLDAVSPRTVTDLLRDADQAFQAANAAQESGDEDAALRQYVRMLELLTEADLDPKIFYALRQEFGNILNTSARTRAVPARCTARWMRTPRRAITPPSRSLPPARARVAGD